MPQTVCARERSRPAREAELAISDGLSLSGVGRGLCSKSLASLPWAIGDTHHDLKESFFPSLVWPLEHGGALCVAR